MLSQHKYLLLSAAVIVIFFGVLVTEVWDRWAATVDLFKEMKEKESVVSNPPDLELKKKGLTAEKESLMGSLMQSDWTYDNSQMGVFEFLHSSAKRAGVRLGSLIPQESRSNNEFEEIGFKIQLVSDFHRIGQYVNALETRGMPVQMKRTALERNREGGRDLRLDLEGTALIPTKRALR